jgi:hypothetical protein
MNKSIIALAAAVAGLVVGVAGARVFTQAPAKSVCATAIDPAVDAQADTIVRQLHAQDHETYVSHPAPPIGELPKPAKTDSSNAGH